MCLSFIPRCGWSTVRSKCPTIFCCSNRYCVRLGLFAASMRGHSLHAAGARTRIWNSATQTRKRGRDQLRKVSRHCGPSARLLLSVCAVACPSDPLRERRGFHSACQFASIEKREEGGTSGSIGSSLTLSGQWFSGGLLFLFLLMPLVERGVAERRHRCACGAAIASLHFWTEHNSLYIDGHLCAGAQFGLLAIHPSRRAWLALDPIVKCSLRHRLSTFAFPARRVRFARCAGESAATQEAGRVAGGTCGKWQSADGSIDRVVRADDWGRGRPLASPKARKNQRHPRQSRRPQTIPHKQQEFKHCDTQSTKNRGARSIDGTTQRIRALPIGWTK